MVPTRCATISKVLVTRLAVQRLAQGGVGFHVQGRETIVEDVNGCVLHQGARNRQPLFLPAR